MQSNEEFSSRREQAIAMVDNSRDRVANNVGELLQKRLDAEAREQEAERWDGMS